MSIRAGKEWKSVANLQLCGTFLAASYDPNSKLSTLLRFGQREGPRAVSASCFRSAVARRDKVYYVSREGLFCRKFEESDPRLIFASNEGQSFGPLFVAPDDAEAFALQTRTGSNARGTSALRRIDLTSGKSAVVIEFNEYPESLQIAWSKNCLFVSLHESDSVKRIDRIDLKTCERKVVLRSEILHGISLSEMENLIHWPLSDVGPIEECVGDNSTRTLTEFGWFPAVSKTGNMAFLMGDHTLWTRTRDGKISRTAFTWSHVDSGAMVFPSWCECGSHVGAMLSGAYRENWLARDLVIADLQRMEIAVFDQAIVDPALNVGGQAWLSK